MKYYPNALLNGSGELIRLHPYITEIYIPMIASREADIQKFAAKKGFTIENQILYGSIPPVVRLLRKITTATPEPTELDKDMKSYLKSLKAFGIQPSRIYTAIIVPNAVNICSDAAARRVYYSGFNHVEVIASIKAESFKQVAGKALGNRYPHALFIYKNSSDPVDIFKLSLKISIDPYDSGRSINKINDALARISMDPSLAGCMLEQRLEILNHIIV